MFSQEVAMAMANRFIFPTNSLGVAPHLRYALHVDVALMARYLRSIAERAGVILLARKVVSATRREDGFIDELQFEDGGKLRADLFIDCSGSRGQLIGEILESPYEDWKQWLPCDRMVSAPAALEECASAVRAHRRARFRLAVAHAAATDAEPWPRLFERFPGRRGGAAELLAAIGRRAAASSRGVRNSSSGRRRRFWDKNVVALGRLRVSSSRWQPPTCICTTHACSICSIIFPTSSLTPRILRATTRLIGDEFERIRDFIILHYCLSRRDDSPFWQQRREIALPDTLAQRIDMYRATGRIMQRGPELFTDLDWFWIFEGSASCRATTIRWSTPWTSNRSSA